MEKKFNKNSLPLHSNSLPLHGVFCGQTASNLLHYECSAHNICIGEKKKIRVKEGRMEISGKNAHLIGLHDLLGKVVMTFENEKN